MKSTKYIFVTGGVVSGLGKGITYLSQKQKINFSQPRQMNCPERKIFRIKLM